MAGLTMAGSIYDKMMGTLQYDSSAGTSALNAAAGAFQGMASTFHNMRQSIIDEEQKNLQREMEKQHHREEMDYKDRSLAQDYKQHSERLDFERLKHSDDMSMEQKKLDMQWRIANLRSSGGGGGGGSGRGRKKGSLGPDDDDIALGNLTGRSLGAGDSEGVQNPNGNSGNSGNASPRVQSPVAQSPSTSNSRSKKSSITDAMFDLVAGDIKGDDPSEDAKESRLSLGLSDNPVKKESSGSPITRSSSSRNFDLGASSLRPKDAFADVSSEDTVKDQGMPLSIYPTDIQKRQLDIEQAKKDARTRAFERTVLGNAIKRRLDPESSNDALENLTGIKTRTSRPMQNRLFEAPNTQVELPDDPKFMELQRMRETLSGDTQGMQPRDSSPQFITRDGIENIDMQGTAPLQFELNNPDSSFSLDRAAQIDRSSAIVENRLRAIEAQQAQQQEADYLNNQRQQWFNAYNEPSLGDSLLGDPTGENAFNRFNSLSTNDKIQEITRRKLQNNQEYLGLLSDYPSESDRKKAEDIRKAALTEATAEVSSLYGQPEKAAQESTMLDEIGPAVNTEDAKALRETLKSAPIFDEEADIVDPGPDPTHTIDFNTRLTAKDYRNYTGSNVSINGAQALETIRRNPYVFDSVFDIRQHSKTKNGLDEKKYNSQLVELTYELASLPERERAAAMEACMAAREVMRSNGRRRLSMDFEKMAKILGSTFSPSYNPRDRNYRGRLYAETAIAFGVNTDTWETRRSTYQTNINKAYKASRDKLGIVKVGKMGLNDIKALSHSVEKYDTTVRNDIKSAFNKYFDFNAPIRYAYTHKNRNGDVDSLYRDIAATAHATALGIVLDAYVDEGPLLGHDYKSKIGFNTLMRDLQDPNTKIGREYLNQFQKEIARMEDNIPK